MTTRRFAVLLLALLAVLAALYTTAAVLVDPRGTFGLGLARPVTWNTREAKVELFEKYNRQRPVEGLILGSSRTMKIAPGECEVRLGKRFFNFCVARAMTEDYLSIYRWARARAPRVAVLLIGLDVDALLGDERRQVTLEGTGALLKTLEGRGRTGGGERAGEVLGRLDQILGRDYALDMVRSLWVSVRGTKADVAWEADGALQYLDLDRQRARGIHPLEPGLADSLQRFEKTFGGAAALSARRRGFLEALLDEAGRDGVDVVLWITPLHPFVARRLAQGTRYEILLDETRGYVKALGSRYGVRTFDLSEPSSFGGSDSGWYDGEHMDAANAARIVQKLAEGARPAGR